MIPPRISRRAQLRADWLRHKQLAVNNPRKKKKRPPGSPKNPAAVELGRLGGLASGKTRKLKIHPAKLTELARFAAFARWWRKNRATSSLWPIRQNNARAAQRAERWLAVREMNSGSNRQREGG